MSLRLQHTMILLQLLPMVKTVLVHEFHLIESLERLLNEPGILRMVKQVPTIEDRNRDVINGDACRSDLKIMDLKVLKTNMETFIM